MRWFTIHLIWISIQYSLCAQPIELVFAITQSTEKEGELVFTVSNLSDQLVETGVFEKSDRNRVLVKNNDDVLVSFFGVHEFVPDKVILEPQSTQSWTYNAAEFFYPAYPTRFADEKGIYKIIWLFNGVEHGFYLYDFK